MPFSIFVFVFYFMFLECAIRILFYQADLKFLFRKLVHRLLMTACDLCTSAKPWSVHTISVKKVYEEFYQQVRKTVSFLCSLVHFLKIAVLCFIKSKVECNYSQLIANCFDRREGAVAFVCVVLTGPL